MVSLRPATTFVRCRSFGPTRHLVAWESHPTSSGLPVWKEFDEESQMAMVFSDSSHSQPLRSITGLKARSMRFCGAPSRKIRA
jgi:hypothetical protein